jgi:hypothetical protein
MSFELRCFLELPEPKDRRPLAIGLALPGMVDTEKAAPQQCWATSCASRSC